MIEIRVAILRGGAAGAAAILCACTRTLCITRVYQLCERGWFPDVNNTGEIRHKNLVSEVEEKEKEEREEKKPTKPNSLKQRIFTRLAGALPD